MPERTYTQEEVAAIFAKAAERQHPASTRDTSTGLTLAEVEQAGLEAGLDPAAIRAAAAELGAQRRFPPRPKVAVAERWIDAPIEAGAWEDVVASLRHRFGTNTNWWGKDTAALGHAQEWTHTAASGTSTTVTLSPREGRTLLRVVQEEAGLEDERQMGWLVAAFIGLLPSMLAGAIVAETLGLGDFAGVAAVALVLLAAVAFGGPRLAGRIRKGREQQAARVQQVADDLVGQIEGARLTMVAVNPAEPSIPHLDLSALGSEVAEPPIQSERRRARS